MSAALGIDFGSSQCCAYVVKDGRPELVRTATGDAAFPSWVAFTPQRVLLGKQAETQAPTNPTHTATGIKRFLGRKFYSPETSWLQPFTPNDVIPAPNGDAWFHIGGLARSPQELASYLLELVKRRAEIAAGQAIDSAVLVVPAFFDERQRRSLLEAAKLAGLEVERLLHAPTAAAIAYQFQNPEAAGRWAVLDIGSGGLDVSVLDVGKSRMEVLSSVGDSLLGGDDFDRRIVEHLCDRFYEKHEIDLLVNPAATHRLFSAARTAKHELSQAARSSDFHLRMIARSDDDEILEIREPGIERTLFEDLIQEELDRLADPSARALQDLGFGTDDMDHVLLCGGTARMPMVQDTVGFLYRKRPLVVPNGEALAAMGAALFAAGRQQGVAPVLVDDLSPHSVGIKIRGGRFSPVIHRRSLIPCREQKVFTAAREKQQNVVFEVYQGEQDLVNENTYLGRFTMKSLPYANSLVIAFSLDESGVLSVARGDGVTGNRLTLHASCGLSDEELRELASHREARSKVQIDKSAVAASIKRASLAPPPPMRDGKRNPSLRPGRSDAPSGAPPKSLPKRSLPPPAYVSAETQAPASQRASESPMEVADDSLVGSTVGGRYIIDDIIADGGMGRVYLARHSVLNKKFALKVLHAELAQNEELAGRFVREAQAAARIDSPHVIDISDFGRLDDGTGFFVMEYLAGSTLAHLIHERSALDAGLIADIGMQLTDGLGVAHAIGIVHRDLKPDNITLIQRGGHPYFCKILDFGIAKAPTSDSSKHETLAGTLLGTPHYMAPEQIDGGDMDGRCDIYSLGAVMYEMATGTPPFDAESLVGVLVKHKTEDPKPVRSHALASECPIELQAVIHRCLAKKPADRFQTARELHDALAAVA